MPQLNLIPSPNSHAYMHTDGTMVGYLRRHNCLNSALKALRLQWVTAVFKPTVQLLACFCTVEATRTCVYGTPVTRISPRPKPRRLGGAATLAPARALMGLHQLQKCSTDIPTRTGTPAPTRVYGALVPWPRSLT
jgi:hypothetical protein